MSITLIAFSKTRRGVIDWIQRNESRIPKRFPIVGTYYEDSIIEDLSKAEDLPYELYQGSENLFERLLEIFPKLDTKFVLPIAGDDDIAFFNLPEPDQGFELVTGYTYFNQDGRLLDSKCNFLQFQKEKYQNVILYWSPPMPSDNSIFYSIFNKAFYEAQLKRLIAESYKGAYDAADWVLMSRILTSGKCCRTNGLTIIRDVTPSIDYTARIMRIHERNKADFSNWRSLNPLIYPIKLIQEGLPDEVYKQCLNGWFNVIRHKFAQMRQLYPDFVRIDSEDELNRISAEVTLSIRDTPLDQIIVPLVK